MPILFLQYIYLDKGLAIYSSYYAKITTQFIYSCKELAGSYA